jgi:hypothetical protein
MNLVGLALAICNIGHDKIGLNKMNLESLLFQGGKQCL